METKISQLRNFMEAGDWEQAIKMAAKFPRLGEHKREITTAASAMLKPSFYAQLGKDPQAIIEAGRQALIARYSA